MLQRESLRDAPFGPMHVGCNPCEIPSVMKQLIVNGDDFGLTPGVNQGICRAYRDGILSSATLMANAAAFEDAVQRAKENPGLGLGCHLVLVGGPIVGKLEEVGPLADSAGRLPATLAELVRLVTLGQVSERHIAAEFRAQIGKIRTACRVAGIEPTHCDTHKHTHCHPVVMRALARVMAEMGIRRWRMPYESLADVIQMTGSSRKTGGIRQMAGALVAHVTERTFRGLSRRTNLVHPDRFIGVVATGNLDAGGLAGLLERLPDGVSELMCHPGESDAALRDTGTRLCEQREVELAALVAPGLRDVMAHRGIELIGYDQLGEGNGRAGLSTA